MIEVYNSDYGIGYFFVINLVLGDFLCLFFNRRGYNVIVWKMKDFFIYIWKIILCSSFMGLFVEFCVYIVFKGLDFFVFVVLL